VCREHHSPGHLLALAVFLLFAVTAPAAGPRPVTGTAVPTFAPVDEALQDYMDRVGVQAATVAISRDGKLLYSRGYGWRDARKRTPTAPDTLMRIASISKPITAAEVKKLLRDGKLTPDTRVFPLLGIKPYNGKLGDRRLNDITVGQLLEHKGGWDRDKAFDPVFATADVEKTLRLGRPAAPADVVAYMLAEPLQFAPGERSCYSNFGYMVLGRVIAKVTGRPYGEAVRRDLFEPLGIKDIKLGHSALKARDPREVWYPAPETAFSVEVLDGAGGWIASAPDLCRFLDAYWIHGGPRARGDTGDATFFGGVDGTLAMARQRPDGVNVAVLLDKDGVGETLRKAVDPAVTRSLREVRYAAAWQKRDGPAWVVRHDLSDDDFRKTSAKFAAEGYRVVLLSGCSAHGVAQYAAVWEQRQGPAQKVEIALTADDFKKAADRCSADGYRLAYLTGYSVRRQPRLAAVWEKADGPAPVVRIGLSGDEFGKAFDQFGNDGYRLRSVSGYTAGSDIRYVAVWDKRPGPPWVGYFGLSADDLRKTLDRVSADGFRLTFLNGYAVAGGPRYAGIWEKIAGPPPVVRMGLSAEEYQQETDRLAGEGYRPVALNTYGVSGD
jgi:CubicO group peptidase (beta-lactamase class C family)